MKRLVFLYDSTVEPWEMDLSEVIDGLEKLGASRAHIEIIDTKEMPEAERQHWRDQAALLAMKRQDMRVRQPFGSKKAGGEPFLGRQVPALFVYEGPEDDPTCVYPHQRKDRSAHTSA